MVEERQPPMRYAGRTTDEQIQSAQLHTIGRGIMQRYGQQMTEDERALMSYLLSMFVEPIVGEQGAEPTQQHYAQQPSQQQQQPPQQQQQPHQQQAPGGPRPAAGKKQ